MNNCIPVTLEDKRKIEIICCDGCFYYFFYPVLKTVVKTDLKLHKICSYRLDRSYECICYDEEECCFWASACKNPCALYRLDKEFREIKELALCKHCCSNKFITGISCNCCNHQLVISYPHKIFEVNKQNGACKRQSDMNLGRITDVLCMCPYYYIIAQEQNKQSIYRMDEEGQICQIFCSAFENYIFSLMFLPCREEHYKSSFALGSRNHLGEIKICRFSMEEFCNDCNYCDCNYNKQCGGEHTCRPGDACSIIESIALEEAALAHILNAEGEKLQKVLSLTDDIDLILSVNREIHKTLLHVTSLEQILYSKLFIAAELCGEAETIMESTEVADMLSDD